jgi:hypothetical protein
VGNGTCVSFLNRERGMVRFAMRIGATHVSRRDARFCVSVK